MTIKKETIDCLYVDALPSVNLSGKFIIKKEAFETLSEDWLSFINFFIDKDIDINSTNLKNPLVQFKKSYELNSNNFISAKDRVAEILGLHGELHVISLKRINDTYKFVASMSYNELLFLLEKRSKNKLGKLIEMHTMIDRFLISQYSKERLLFPITKSKQLISRSYSYKHYFINCDILESFSKFMENKNPSTHSYLTGILIYLLSCINITNISNISNDNLKSIEEYIVNNRLDATKQGDSYLFVINELRRMLIFSGREDIDAPIDRKSIASGVNKNDPTRFIENIIDVTLNPNFEEIYSKACEYLLYEKNNGLAAYTIKGKAYNLKTFLSYLIATYPHRKIDIDLIDEIFNPLNKDSIHYYIKKMRDGNITVILSQIAIFLNYSELLTTSVLKNIPKIKKANKVSARQAMPKHMLKHLFDIVLNRPPKTNTKWDINKADISWWPHNDVYPVFPMLILIHLFIPLRGSQIRNLCRENSFELDEHGNIITIIVNTDKNTGRTFLQEIPNVWEQLSILSNFLKWHKEYFKFLPQIDYNDDDMSRWGKITPIMITPKRFKPISQHTHMNYFKKVLLQYQIEVNNKFKEKNDPKRIKILWSKNDDSIIPQEIDILNKCPDRFFTSVQSNYDIHAMRVTGATRYLEAGLGISLVMKLTGHTSPDMLLNVYNKLKLIEKKELLATAVNKIFLTDSEHTTENLKSFLMDELPNNYDMSKPEEVKKAFNDNGLFSLSRKSTSESKGGTTIEQGTDLATLSHPSIWTPMIFGICPAVKCPDGRENRCSLCPYLITGRLFLDGVIHQANLKVINFYRLSKEMQEEENLNYENIGKSENTVLLFEEIMGWFEIILKIQDNIYENKSLPVSYDRQLIGTQLVPPVLQPIYSNTQPEVFGQFESRNFLSVKL